MPATELVDPARAGARLAACVREAGLLARSMFGTAINNWTKAGSSPVCEADIAVDRLLRERLIGEGSDIGWLSEESVDDRSRLAARYVWIVDPIDGTRAFLAGSPDWAVSAALVEEGRVHEAAFVGRGFRQSRFAGCGQSPIYSMFALCKVIEIREFEVPCRSAHFNPTAAAVPKHTGSEPV